MINFINAFGWTLLHSLWQALVIFVVLRLLFVVLREAPAKARYSLSGLALSGIFFWFLWTFYNQWQLLQSRTVMIEASGDQAITTHITVATAIPEHLWQGNNFLIGLVALYALGLMVFMLRMTGDLVALFRIRHSRKLPFDTAWENYLDKLSTEWGISKKVGLFLSKRIDVPVVVGHLKPVIYLPLSMISNLTPEQIESILLHELAHIKRNDFIINILQTTVETLLFFNPFVWLISKTIRRERENCCDEMVVSTTNPQSYAEALLALEENRIFNGRLVLAAGTGKQQLFQRIKNIMEMKTKKLNITQRLLVLAIIGGSVFTIAWIPSTSSDGEQLTKKQFAREDINADSIKTPAAGAVKNVVHASFLKAQNKDTIPPALQPPAPSTVPMPPQPPAPKAALPPMPPQSPMDTLNDHVQKSAQQFYDSDEWQKYKDALKRYAANIKQHYNSDEWKAYRESLKKYSQQVQKYFSSDDWKAFRNDLHQQMQQLKMQIRESGVATDTDSLRQSILHNMPDMDSLMAKVNLMVSAAGQYANNAEEYKNKVTIRTNNHIVSSEEIISLMKADGLLKNNENYTIKLNDKGLFINGKKQPQKYYEKYRSIIGKNTSLAIKKKGNKQQWSLSADNK